MKKDGLNDKQLGRLGCRWFGGWHRGKISVRMVRRMTEEKWLWWGFVSVKILQTLRTIDHLPSVCAFPGWTKWETGGINKTKGQEKSKGEQLALLEIYQTRSLSYLKDAVGSVTIKFDTRWSGTPHLHSNKHLLLSLMCIWF